MSAAQITRILRYPVKSMMGETLATTELGENGIPGDRAWAARDEKRGGIRGGKKIPQLMTLRATSGEVAPRITASDGESILANADNINQWLSGKLDHPVTLWPLVPAEQLDHYRRGAPDDEDFESELRSIFGRLPDEPLPDLSLFAEVIEFESPPGTYFDAFPLLLMSEQSLETMHALGPASNFDVRRFRPNLLLDFTDSDEPFPEQNWIGKSISVGSARIEIVGTCPRCSMTTHGFDGLPRDTDIMRRLVENAGGNLGVYGKIVKTGSVALGDTVAVLSS
jgi:uncharacterized protein YcbX